MKTCPCFTGGVHARLERFISKHAEKIRGTLSCFDRILFRDYLPFFSGAAFAAFLDRRRIRRGAEELPAATGSGRVLHGHRIQEPAPVEELVPRLLEHSTLRFSARDILTFLGRKLHGKFEGEVVTDQVSPLTRSSA